MKKKYIILIIAGILLFVCILGRGIYFYGKFYVPNKSFFGSQYKEILHIMSFQDKKQADEFMKSVDDACSFVGDEETAERKYDKLSRYSITAEGAVKEEHDLKLVTANFNEEDGYLWFAYTQKALDNNDKVKYFSGGVLVRVTLQRNNGSWIVIDTKEHP